MAWRAQKVPTYSDRASASVPCQRARKAARADDCDGQLAPFQRGLRSVLAEQLASGLGHDALACLTAKVG